MEWQWMAIDHSPGSQHHQESLWGWVHAAQRSSGGSTSPKTVIFTVLGCFPYGNLHRCHFGRPTKSWEWHLGVTRSGIPGPVPTNYPYYGGTGGQGPPTEHTKASKVLSAAKMPFCTQNRPKRGCFQPTWQGRYSAPTGTWACKSLLGSTISLGLHI